MVREAAVLSRRSAACRKSLDFLFSSVLPSGSCRERLPSRMQIYMSETTAAIMGPGGDYLPDRAVSDVDDPDLGAAALADDAVGGGDGAGSSEEGGGVETWPNDDDDDDEDEPRPTQSTANPGTGPSTGSPTRGGKRKRKQGAALFGSVPKKPKNLAAATRWK